MFPNTDKLPGNGVKGFIPRDALKFALSSLADPLHGKQETIGVIYPLP
jgi:hypothetical protein